MATGAELGREDQQRGLPGRAWGQGGEPGSGLEGWREDGGKDWIILEWNGEALEGFKQRSDGMYQI